MGYTKMSGEVFKAVSYSLPPSSIDRLKLEAKKAKMDSASQLLRAIIDAHFNNLDNENLNNPMLSDTNTLTKDQQNDNNQSQKVVREPAPVKKYLPKIDFET